MNKTIIILIAFALLSCKEISFHEPQPKGLKALTSIPKSLQGKYLTFQENGELAKDTVVITAKGYHITYFNEANLNAGSSQYDNRILNDSLVLKFYKGYYFLNFNEKPEWILRVLQQEKDGDITYMAPEQQDVDFKDYLKKLSSNIKVDSFQVKNETIYQIDPSPHELIQLIEKGYFSKLILKKVK